MGLRFAGMTIGVLVSFASAWVPFDAVGLSGLFGPLGIGLAGAPVAAVLGWWLSPHIVSSSWRNAIAIGFGAGLLAPVLGLLELLYIAAVAGLAEGPGQGAETIGGLLFVGMYGLGYCWVVLPITLPSGIAAALIVRGLLPRVSWSPSASIGFRHAVIVLGLAALGAALVPFAQTR
jgi:hypothetical protein